MRKRRASRSSFLRRITGCSTWRGFNPGAGADPCGRRRGWHGGGAAGSACRRGDFCDGEPGKWEALRALGLAETHIASSRELAFESRVLAATVGRGVDVVLNSLAREFVDASLRLLPQGGRFLEMGKTDIREPQRLPLRILGSPTARSTCARPGLIVFRRCWSRWARCSSGGCSGRCRPGAGTCAARRRHSALSRRRDTSAKWFCAFRGRWILRGRC